MACITPLRPTICSEAGERRTLPCRVRAPGPPFAWTPPAMLRTLPLLVVAVAAGASLGTATAALANDATPREISFDDIKLELKKDQPFDPNLLTAKVTELDGMRIRIRGYMLPSFQQKGITRFILVRDNQECCFGPGAALHDCIVVDMIDGASAAFSTRPITVEGVFKIKEFKGPNGKHLAIYHLDGQDAR